MNDRIAAFLAESTPFSMERFLVGALLALLLGLALRWMYLRYGRTISAKESLGNLFPLLTFATLVVISVIKSSLALSLGLVGALSIVRFRAAIKEPEELVFLFLAIAIGLALGAGQLQLAIASTAIIGGLLIVRSRFQRYKGRENVLITFEGKADALFAKQDNIVHLIETYATLIDIQRVTLSEGSIQLRMLVALRSDFVLPELTEKLHRRFPDAHISFMELSALP
ncbi:DUF4956 domain-containing protein [Candidatus Uhrbacteria bacterium]|nr:DUF4956 domain-containing protein [Candidatus Uhrbacteria bacterium]